MSEGIARVARLAAANGVPLAPVDASGQAADTDPAAELAAILGLNALDLAVTGAELFGRGSNAVAHVHLSDGARVVLDPLGRFASPAKLAFELALQVGAAPALKMPLVMRAMVLLHQLADHHDTLNADDRASDWGIAFLQQAQILPVEMSDQAARWASFELLSRTDPVSTARSEGSSIALGSIVLDDQATGTRYVRASWYGAYVRQQGGPSAADEAARSMRRVGWEKPGREGRIKATSPARDATLQWAFFQVPAGWEKQ